MVDVRYTFLHIRPVEDMEHPITVAKDSRRCEGVESGGINWLCMEEQVAEVVKAAKVFLAYRASKASKENLSFGETYVMSYDAARRQPMVFRLCCGFTIQDDQSQVHIITNGMPTFF